MLSINLKPKTENIIKLILSQYENQEDFAHSIIDNEVAELKKRNRKQLSNKRVGSSKSFIFNVLFEIKEIIMKRG